MKNKENIKSVITEKNINYLEQMTKQLIDSLKDFYNDYTFGDFIFASKSRAKFDRLRLELQDELLKIKKEMYKEN